MTDRNKKKTKIRNGILKVLLIVLIAGAVASGFLWNRYLNKTSLFEKYETPKAQEVYLLGTLHENHFDKWAGYSMKDILSLVKNLRPDSVFIEAREEYFKSYGVMDGPVDMALVYSYCIENDIPVEMVDWWVVDNSFKSNTTSEKRDDRIFANIAGKLDVADEGARILVVCGAGHFYEQDERFLNYGFEKRKIEKRAAYFDSQDKGFEYPSGTERIWERRAYFYAYTYPEIVGQDETLDDAVKAEFTGGDSDAFYNQQLKYCELFSNNQLYR